MKGLIRFARLIDKLTKFQWMKGLIRFARLIDKLTEFQGAISAFLVVVVVLVGFYNVATRYLGRFIGLQLSSNVYIELQWYLFSAIFFLGFAYILKHHINVRVDFLYAKWSETRRALVDFWGTILFLIPFCLIGLFVTITPVWRSWVIWEMSSDADGLPRAPVKSLIVIAFTFLLLQSIAQAIKFYAVMRGHHEVAAEIAADATGE